MDSAWAELGVALGLVLHVERRSLGGADVQLDGAEAVLAAKLRVAIVQRVDDGLEFPEWLIASGGTDAATFYLALVNHLSFSSHHEPPLVRDSIGT